MQPYGADLAQLLEGISELLLGGCQLSGTLCLGLLPGRAQLRLLRLQQRVRPRLCGTSSVMV